MKMEQIEIVELGFGRNQGFAHVLVNESLNGQLVTI